MVAYLEKSDENAEFHQRVDFLSTCSINYALTAVVISESSVRNDLLFDDEDGITCLTNDEIFENLALMGYEQLSTKLTFPKGGGDSVERAITTNACLVAAQDSDKIIRTQTTSMPNVDIPQGMDTGSSPRCQETTRGAPAQTRSERVLKQPNEPPLPEGHTSRSGEGRMAHTFELMDIVPPTPHDSPLPGEKDAQAVEILTLKKRVKKLERQRKSSISHPRRRIYRQVESSDDDLDEEDASKQGRKSNKTKPIFKDSDFDGLDDDMENVEGETVYAATSGVSTAGALVSTARPTVSTVGPSTSAAGTSTGILEDEMVTMADTLIAIRQTRTRPSYLPRPTSVVITDTEQEQRRLTTPPPSQPSDTRDKGKGIMVEPDPLVKIKRSDQGDLQLQADAELAQLLHQEELAQVERRQRERAAQEEASIAALYEEEREQFTIEERAQFLVETIAAQRKFRAAQRATEIRSKPPTKTQLRNMMITYLKNMGKFNHNQLKGKSYEELQRLYEREQKLINDFVPMDSKKEENKSVEPKSEGKKGKRIKRSDEDAAANYEHEKEELRMWLTVVPDEEETVDLEILSAKYPIVDWESQNLGNVDMEDLHVYKIIRADGNTSYYKSLFSMLRKFDRQDLGDLKVMFEPNIEDEIWSNQQDWTLISWKLYENCGVHTLLMDGTLTCFNMLVEKRYPLIKEMLEKMLNWKLEAEAESTMEFELLKFIKSQLED
ncbi:hypothetical protein Tco_0272947 [Tanacetum coccineum]